MRQKEISFDALDATLDLNVVETKHNLWRQWMAEISQSQHHSPSHRTRSVRDLWNEINSTISEVLELSSKQTPRPLNFQEISSVIQSLLTPSLSLEVLEHCQQSQDPELLLTIFHFMRYHAVPVHTEMVTVILEGLKGQKRFQQNAVEIFNDFIFASNSLTTAKPSMTKRDKLRLKRKRNTDLRARLDSLSECDRNEMTEHFEAVPKVMSKAVDESECGPLEQPDLSLFNAALECFADSEDLKLSQHTISTMKYRFGIEPDERSYAALLRSCDSVESALCIFNELAQSKETKLAVHHFNSLMAVRYKSIAKEPDNNQLREMIKFFHSMIREYGVEPNSTTFSILFNSCAVCRELEMALNLLSFLVKHCRNTVILDNEVIAGFIRCCHENNEHKMALEFYENLFLFGSDHGVDSRSKSKQRAAKWEQSELIQLQRSSKPNVVIFGYLLDSNVGAKGKGIHSQNIGFIQSQMKQHGVKPDASFYRKLLGIADGAEQKTEIYKLCRLVLSNMSRGTVECEERTLAVMVGLLWKYGFFDGAVQIYDFWHRELRLTEHWLRTEPNNKHNKMRGNRVRRRRSGKSQSQSTENPTEKDTISVLKVMDLTAFEVVTGCVAIRYVLTTEWRDLTLDLLIKVESQEYAERLIMSLNEAFVPSITDNAVFDEEKRRLTIKSEDIRLWILYQAQMGK